MGASWEEARRCPADGSPGEIQTKIPLISENVPRGTQIVRLICKNTRCEYNEVPFIVQINPDGTIPDPTMMREKHFPSHGAPSQRARDSIRQIAEEQAASAKPGAEVESPWRPR